jgi:hypothetical protein
MQHERPPRFGQCVNRFVGNGAGHRSRRDLVDLVAVDEAVTVVVRLDHYAVEEILARDLEDVLDRSELGPGRRDDRRPDLQGHVRDGPTRVHFSSASSQIYRLVPLNPVRGTGAAAPPGW